MLKPAIGIASPAGVGGDDGRWRFLCRFAVTTEHELGRGPVTDSEDDDLPLLHFDGSLLFGSESNRESDCRVLSVAGSMTWTVGCPDISQERLISELDALGLSVWNRLTEPERSTVGSFLLESWSTLFIARDFVGATTGFGAVPAVVLDMDGIQVDEKFEAFVSDEPSIIAKFLDDMLNGGSLPPATLIVVLADEVDRRFAAEYESVGFRRLSPNSEWMAAMTRQTLTGWV